MRDNGQKCFVQAYNAQIAVDTHAQVIVAAELTQQTVDRQAAVVACKKCMQYHPEHPRNHHRRCGLLGHNQPAGSVVEKHSNSGFP